MFFSCLMWVAKVFLGSFWCNSVSFIAHWVEIKTARVWFSAGKYDPCIDNEVETYFNRPDVQLAMHANTTGLPWAWTGCSDHLQYSMSVTPALLSLAALQPLELSLPLLLTTCGSR